MSAAFLRWVCQRDHRNPAEPPLEASGSALRGSPVRTEKGTGSGFAVGRDPQFTCSSDAELRVAAVQSWSGAGQVESEGQGLQERCGMRMAPADGKPGVLGVAGVAVGPHLAALF